MCRSTIRAAILAALATAAPVASSLASVLEVAPVVTELAAGQGTAVLTVTNRGTQPAAAQLRGYAWSQPGGEDRLEPTPDLVVSPPIFELAPGRSQTVRLVLRGAAADVERSYRVLLDEIPPPGRDGAVRLALRLSLPVFVQPAGTTAARLEWRLQDGRLAVANRGTRRARLTDVTIAAGGAREALAVPGTPYVLPGAERRFPVSGRAFRAGAAARVTATSEGGPLTMDLPAGR